MKCEAKSILGLLFGLLIVFISGFWIGMSVKGDAFWEEAIEHGAAEWRCDPATGEREFHWLKERQATEAARGE